MRVVACVPAVAACVVACSSATTPAPTAASSPTAARASVDPARVERVRADLPTDYEFTPLPARAEPVALWGLGPQWTDPSACAALGDPAEGAAVRGWSASGPGGIVYAVVADAVAGLDQAVVDACGAWRVSAGHTSGGVGIVPAPVVEGAPTLGLSADVTTTVEGGTETRSHAETFVAYLGGHVASVTVGDRPRVLGSRTGSGRRVGLARRDGGGGSRLTARRRVHWRRCPGRQPPPLPAGPSRSSWPGARAVPPRTSRRPTSRRCST